MSGYTSGPWTVAADGFIRAEGSRLWIASPIDIPHKCGGEAATKANSHLLAAAPELLEALIEANDETKLYEGHPGRWAELIAKAEVR